MIVSPKYYNEKELLLWSQDITNAINSIIKVVNITVGAGTSSASSSADNELVGGTVLGYIATSNQDQFVDSIVLNVNGSVTITLAANATANNVFAVSVKRNF